METDLSDLSEAGLFCRSSVNRIIMETDLSDLSEGWHVMEDC